MSRTVTLSWRLARHGQGLAILVGTLLTMAPLLTAAACGPGHPEGRYDLIGVRAASGVAAPLPAPGASRWPRGNGIQFDRTLLWHDGTQCRDWRLEPLSAAPLDPSDPLLSDVQLPPIGPNAADHRQNKSFRVICKTGSLGTLLLVDSRLIVLPAPNGARHAVFEKPLSATQADRLQEALTEAGYAPQSTAATDATLDEGADKPDTTVPPDLRAAIARFAADHGAAYVFYSPAISLNLMGIGGNACTGD